MVAALAVAGCAVALPPATATTGGAGEGGRPVDVARCADSDPNRFAWFCVVGRALYNIAAALQSENVRRR
jgi:hypothetical protein